MITESDIIKIYNEFKKKRTATLREFNKKYNHNVSIINDFNLFLDELKVKGIMELDSRNFKKRNIKKKLKELQEAIESNELYKKMFSKIIKNG